MLSVSKAEIQKQICDSNEKLSLKDERYGTSVPQIQLILKK